MRCGLHSEEALQRTVSQFHAALPSAAGQRNVSRPRRLKWWCTTTRPRRDARKTDDSSGFGTVPTSHLPGRARGSG